MRAGRRPYPMSDDQTQDGDDFTRLLRLLDPDEDAAVEKYHKLRRGLIRFFASLRCYEADDLAAVTLMRVATSQGKIQGLPPDQRVPFIYGIARNVYREWLRRERRHMPDPSPPPPGHDEVALDCLDQCLERLPPESRELVVEYYRGEGRAKIEHRKELARRLDIELNALRIRACNKRALLRDCVRDCINAAGG